MPSFHVPPSEAVGVHLTVCVRTGLRAHGLRSARAYAGGQYNALVSELLMLMKDLSL